MAALVWGLLAVTSCGLFGFIAIGQANAAQKRIAKNRNLDGAGMASAGRTLGIIGLGIALISMILVTPMVVELVRAKQAADAARAQGD